MKKKKREEKDEDGGADEFTVPKDKPSIGDGTKRKTQPSWWEADGSHGSTSAHLFGKKKREEMKNPAMRNTLRCGPNEQEIRVNAAMSSKRKQNHQKKRK